MVALMRARRLRADQCNRAAHIARALICASSGGRPVWRLRNRTPPAPLCSGARPVSSWRAALGSSSICFITLHLMPCCAPLCSRGRPPVRPARQSICDVRRRAAANLGPIHQPVLCRPPAPARTSRAPSGVQLVCNDHASSPIALGATSLPRLAPGQSAPRTGRVYPIKS